MTNLLATLPEDVEREVWRRVYDKCLKDVVKDALMRSYLVFISWGDDDDDLSWRSFDVLDDALQVNNLTYQDVSDFVDKADWNCGKVVSLVDMIESDNDFWRAW